MLGGRVWAWGCQIHSPLFKAGLVMSEAGHTQSPGSPPPPFNLGWVTLRFNTCTWDCQLPSHLENLQVCDKICFKKFALNFLAEHFSDAETGGTSSTFSLKTFLRSNVMIQSLLRIGQCKSLPRGLKQSVKDSRTMKQQQRWCRALLSPR